MNEWLTPSILSIALPLAVTLATLWASRRKTGADAHKLDTESAMEIINTLRVEGLRLKGEISEVRQAREDDRIRLQKEIAEIRQARENDRKQLEERIGELDRKLRIEQEEGSQREVQIQSLKLENNALHQENVALRVRIETLERALNQAMQSRKRKASQSPEAAS